MSERGEALAASIGLSHRGAGNPGGDIAQIDVPLRKKGKEQPLGPIGPMWLMAVPEEVLDVGEKQLDRVAFGWPYNLVAGCEAVISCEQKPGSIVKTIEVVA